MLKSFYNISIFPKTLVLNNKFSLLHFFQIFLLSLKLLKF